MRIARVFPRKTKATPDDELCFFGGPPLCERVDLPGMRCRPRPGRKCRQKHLERGLAPVSVAHTR